MFENLHHIGVAARDMDAAIRLYAEGGGARLVEREPSRDGTMEIVVKKRKAAKGRRGRLKVVAA